MSKNRKTFTLLLLIITVFTISFVDIKGVEASNFGNNLDLMCKYEGKDSDGDQASIIIKYKKNEWYCEDSLGWASAANRDAYTSDGLKEVSKFSKVFQYYNSGGIHNYMGKTTQNELASFIKCPDYAYIDTNGLNERCYDNGSYCKQKGDIFTNSPKMKLTYQNCEYFNPDRSSELQKYFANLTPTTQYQDQRARCSSLAKLGDEILEYNEGQNGGLLKDNSVIYGALLSMKDGKSECFKKDATISDFTKLLNKNKSNANAFSNGLDAAYADVTSAYKDCANYCDTLKDDSSFKEICDKLNNQELDVLDSLKRIRTVALPKSNLKNKSEAKCDSILGTYTDKNGYKENTVGWLLQKVFNIFKIIAPLLVLGLTIFDFAKAVISQDQDSLKKAGNVFVKRLIIMVVLFFLPTILSLLLDIVGQNQEPGMCFIK